MTDIGKRINQLRIERDLTLEMVAFDINAMFNPSKPLNKGMISRWENDQCQPTLENAKQLSMYFNVSLDYLIGLTDVRTPSRLLAQRMSAYAKGMSENYAKKGDNQ